MVRRISLVRDPDWRSTLAATGMIMVILAGLVGCAPLPTQQPSPAAVSPEQIQPIAERAYPYGLQQVIYLGQRWIGTQHESENNMAYAGTNRFAWVRTQISPDFPVVTPNATTLYGSGWLDLRREPVVVEVPAIEDRYYSLQAMDHYGIFHTTVGSPFNGTEARMYLFVPPGYEGPLPEGIPTTEIISWPTKTVFVIVRIAVETGTAEEIAEINAYQDQITATPLSEWIANGNAGVPQSERAIVPGDYPVYARMPAIAMGQVDKQTAKDFFTLLHMVLNDPGLTVMKDSLAEAAMLDELRSIGIGEGLEFDWDSLPAETTEALEAGFAAGFESVRAKLRTGLTDMNGWMVGRMSGSFETDWMDRAVMADAGWGGPDKAISHTGAFRFTDSEGQPLHGSSNYTITFDLSDLPPVTQFWSVPIYNENGYLVGNEINRYEINSYMLEHGDLVTEDGKLVIYVQHRRPEDEEAAKNWLPAPPDVFRFTARFYGPYPPVLDGSYNMPAPVRTGPAEP